MLPLEPERDSVEADVQAWIAHLMLQRVTPGEALVLLGYSGRIEGPSWGKVEHNARRIARNLRRE